MPHDEHRSRRLDGALKEREGMRTFCFVTATALAAACASTASAQLVFGTTTPNTSNPAAVYLNVGTGATTTLWNSVSQKKVNGLAADTSTGHLYSNDAARLSVWNYGSVGTAPTLIAGMYRTNDFITYTATGVDGLAWAHGQLYGATSFGSTIYDRGIYSINTTPDSGNRCVMQPLWLDPTGVGSSSGTIALGGIDFNPADDKFWAVNGSDDTSTGGTYTRGLFTIDAFGSGALTKIANFPAGHTQIDGLAIGGGYAWLTEQAPSSNTVNIFGYNIAAGVYDKNFTFTLADGTQRASGATWAPGATQIFPAPSAAALFMLAGGVASRRRR